jgi:hypothetical protein
VRRALVVLLAALSLAAGLLVATGTSAQAASYDRALGRGECALTGRVFVAGQGCSRTRCLPGATLDKTGRDAELCERRGPHGWAYGQPINQRRCAALGRRWVDEVNICASNPDRARRVVRGAPQCTDPRATYVNHSEEEGYYDECLPPNRLRKAERFAKRQRLSLNKAALDLNRFNCSYRAGWVMSGGRCTKRLGPVPADALGGTFMTGDSVSWRADGEIHARARSWVLDLRPGRRLDELQGRLDWFRANHGEPDRVIIQLGTNRRAGYTEQQFRATMATIAPGTPVLMFLPYRHPDAGNASLVSATKKYAGWIRSLAAERPSTCLADWPSYAAQHLGNLVDGEHPDRQHEGWYARYVLRSWAQCEAALGL